MKPLALVGLIDGAGMGPLALAMIRAIWNRAPWRHVAQVIICTCELYGGWMTFGPEVSTRLVAVS